MPSYYYRARDANGRAHEGIEVATSEEDVLRLLEGQQLVPVFIEARAGDEATAEPHWSMMSIAICKSDFQ